MPNTSTMSPPLVALIEPMMISSFSRAHLTLIHAVDAGGRWDTTS